MKSYISSCTYAFVAITLQTNVIRHVIIRIAVRWSTKREMHEMRIRRNAVIVLISLGVSLLSCNDLGEYTEPFVEPPLTSDIQSDWSPDGNWIVYRHEDINDIDTLYPSGLYVINSAGGNRRRLVGGMAFSPRWSRDGNWIAFSAGRIYVVKPNGDSLTAVTSFAAFFPSWSPQGNRVVCGRSGSQDSVGIWIVDVASRSAFRFGHGGAADWSPDGNIFVYAGAVDAHHTGVVTVRVDDPSSRRVLLQDRDKDHRHPRWSPDGALIAWFIFLDAPWKEIWIMSSDGQNPRKLVDGFDVAWKPSSDRIVFSKQTRDRVRLWTVRTDGSELRQLIY